MSEFVLLTLANQKARQGNSFFVNFMKNQEHLVLLRNNACLNQNDQKTLFINWHSAENRRYATLLHSVWNKHICNTAIFQLVQIAKTIDAYVLYYSIILSAVRCIKMNKNMVKVSQTFLFLLKMFHMVGLV